MGNTSKADEFAIRKLRDILLHIKYWTLKVHVLQNLFLFNLALTQFLSSQERRKVLLFYYKWSKYLGDSLYYCNCWKTAVLLYVLSPSPWDTSSCRGRSGRSTRLSPWFIRASFRTSNPFKTTIQDWPIRRLYTSPYFPANWEWRWERRKSMMLHITENRNIL